MPALTAVVEIGPATVRRIAPLPVVSADAGMVAAALRGIDDPVVLVDERPVEVAALWRSIIGSVAGSGSVRLTVVVPSWWPQLRVERVLAAGAGSATEVVASPRWRCMVNGTDDSVVIELADELVAVCAGESIALRGRACPPEAVARVAIRAAPDAATVVIDAPAGVVGGDESARRIRSALDNVGRAAATVPITDVVPAGAQACPTTPALPRRFSPSPAVVAAAVVAIVLCGAGIATEHRRASEAPAASVETTDLVEGRVTVRIPLRWNVTRVTAGPGSRRVQVSSAEDRGVALHITQSYVPGETLDTTADVLQHELGNQQPGVFTDFRPRDQRAGREVITYREVRGTRDVGWVVLIDGATRIAIGCQSATDRADAVAGVCDEAVRSAREITGTAGPH